MLKQYYLTFQDVSWQKHIRKWQNSHKAFPQISYKYHVMFNEDMHFDKMAAHSGVSVKQGFILSLNTR